ncbi:MAG: ComEC/Rec2 family competence protein, partial [Planctomycetota bacterium]|nr:ComEC/Rec2 family competence protein [Planctomycetota bacterium]
VGRWGRGIEAVGWGVGGAACAVGGLVMRGVVCRALLCAAVVALGAGWFGLRVRSAPEGFLGRHLDAVEERLVCVEGVLLEDVALRAGGRGRFAGFVPLPAGAAFRMEAWRLVGDGGAVDVSGEWFVPVSGGAPDVEAGDVVRVRGMATGIGGARNPGEIDFRLWAMERGIAGRVDVATPELVERIDGEWGWVARARHGWLEFTADLRGRAARLLEWDEGESRARRLSATNSESSRALLNALLLGERTESLRDVETSFTRLGLAHMLSISGLHVAILAWVAAIGLRLFGDHARLQSIALAIAIVALLIVVPARTPVVRASVMILGVLAAEAAGRRYDRINTLGWIAVGMLLWRPLDLWTPGFQLSFGVVAALMTLAPLLGDRWFGAAHDPDERTVWQWWGRKVGEAAAAAVAA